jgi:glycosyltransferase involved in cell wall biosynthesis
MNDCPKISIVTPSFNQGKYLENTICSILCQNYPNLEYIIIDGGSTDNSIEIIKKYERHLAYWVSEPDDGQYHAINKGFALSTGEILAWLNSDDIYCPWALKTVASVLSSFPQIEWLTSLYPGSFDKDGFCTGFGSLSGFSRDAFLDGEYLPIGGRYVGWIQQESTFWRKSLWDKIGGAISTRFNLAGDFDLWAKFYKKAELYGLASPLAGFRHHGIQKSHMIEQYIAEALVSLSEIREYYSWSPSLLRNILKNMRIYKIPKVRKLFYNNYYCGNFVYRNLENKNLPSWEIRRKRFFM